MNYELRPTIPEQPSHLARQYHTKTRPSAKPPFPRIINETQETKTSLERPVFKLRCWNLE